ncbi:2-dehydro-3-deoxyphosphooctonate aldolase 1 [Sesamum angolense]|uniref:3-deoxy-8-phosphooctulonate synthase n=1 Tax=Sesamum angolense TaxID=2727404 RepID=A0AAE2BUY8_9LAMI|nr:2-dehydro-3-deoxyphosphooctonate aldolase 1 [Sesamum angolense]
MRTRLRSHFFLLAGPNVIESEEHILHMAKQIKAISSKLGLPLVFKSSFDKANRTSSKSFRGPGLAEGLKILERVKTTYDLPVVTDVHETVQCEAVGRVADIIQIPAFLCRQTDLLVAAAKTGRIINIKKGQFCAPSVMVNSAEKIRMAGKKMSWFVREAQCLAIVADITHSLQQPAGRKLEGGGVASGGLRELIPCIARTAVAVGVDGIFMEVHDDPLNAPVDGPTQWPLRHLEELLEELMAIANGFFLLRSHSNPERGGRIVHRLLLAKGIWSEKDMVAVKGRLNPLKGVTQDQKTSNRGQAKNLKIYAEVDKVKKRDTLTNGTKGKVVPRDSSTCELNVNYSESGVKNSENNKNKPRKSEPVTVNSNVGRKVLADIGNIRGSLSKTEQGKSSRPTKGKSEMMYPERNREDLGNMDAKSSDEPSRVNQTLDSFKATDDRQTLKKPPKKIIAATSDEPRTKFKGRSSTTSIGRKLVRDPLHLPRKSLPVLKQVSQIETSGAAKENSDKSDHLRGKHGFHVKPSVRRSIIPKPSNLSSRPWGNRVSDGFVMMASRAQTKVDAGVSSRKSVKGFGCYTGFSNQSPVNRGPTVKTTVTALNTQRTSRSTQTLATKKLRSKPSDLITRKQDKDSASKNIPSVVFHEEPSQEENISGGPSNSISDIIGRRKSDRRNSFTCSLMSRSKLLKECGKVAPQENLPNIYDDRNHLEVGDYVDDIYQYYWVLEGQNPLMKNYMDIQREITPQMRGILINWLIEVHLKFELMEETLFLTMTLLDRYLALESIKKNEMQLVGLTALLLASKYEDFWHPREKTILKKLKFRLNEPTPYVFMLRFLKAAQSDMKFEHLAFYLIELCLVEYEALNYKPSMLCASAIYVARCTMHMTPPWTPLLAKHARYEESQIRSCAEMILKFHRAAKTNLLKVTFEKYMKLDYSRVATIKPLDRLPA